MNTYELIAPTAGEAAALDAAKAERKAAAEQAAALAAAETERKADAAYAVVRAKEKAAVRANIEKRKRIAAEDAVARAEIKAQCEADAKYAAAQAAYAAAQAAAKAECKAATEQAVARAAEEAEREADAAEAVMSARRFAIRDRAVIWVDAVEYGRGSQVGLRVDTDAGPYTATVLSTAGIWGRRRGEGYSRMSAECYAVLKGVEIACECGLKHCVIRNNSIGGLAASTLPGRPATEYLRLAKKMAQAVGLKVEFEMCALGENLAEAVNYR